MLLKNWLSVIQKKVITIKLWNYIVSDPKKNSGCERLSDMQLGVLPKESISIEVTAAPLINKGVSYLEEQLEKIKKSEGGVLFIDEAYQLSEDKIAGTRILDFMLPHADSLDGEFGKLVWILAGYSNKMEIS